MASLSPTSRIIETLISGEPRQLLKPLGYKKHGRSFIVETGKLYKIVNFQSSVWNSPESARFTINLYVTFVCFHEKYLGTAFPRNPASAAQVVQQRIGPLLAPGRDHWWEVTTQTDTQVLGGEIAHVLRAHALPFLAPFHQVEDLLRHLRRGEGTLAAPAAAPHAALCRAIVLWCNDEKQQAQHVLEELRAGNLHPSFGRTITLIESRLGADH